MLVMNARGRAVLHAKEEKLTGDSFILAAKSRDEVSTAHRRRSQLILSIGPLF